MLGCGPEVARRLGLRPDWVIDVHNGGCAAFVHMMALAQKILQTHRREDGADRGRPERRRHQVFTQSEIRKLAHAPVPGDGCGVGLLVKSDDAPILGVECRTYPEFAGDMTFEACRDGDRKYWEPGEGQAASASPNPRSPRCSPAATAWCRRWRSRCCDRIGVQSARRRHLRHQPTQPAVPAELARGAAAAARTASGHLRRVRKSVRRGDSGHAGHRQPRRAASATDHWC